MDTNDIKQLQKVIRTEIGDALEQIVLPALVTLKTDVGRLKEDVGQLKEDVSRLKDDVGHIKGQLNTRFPDKAYLDDKLNELRGDILKGRKQDSARLDKLIAFQRQKKQITDEEVQILETMRPFAPLPANYT